MVSGDEQMAVFSNQTSTIASTLLSDLDKNGDGVVGLTEFIDNFMLVAPLPVFDCMKELGLALHLSSAS
jgi:hypothetical protein